MKKKSLVLGLIFVIIAVMVLASGCASSPATAPDSSGQTAAITFTDDVGRTIKLAKPLARVVVFNKMNSEIIRALGKASTIVGTDAGTLQDKDYFPDWNQSMLAGKSQTSIDYEKVAALKPDAVIIPSNGSYQECEQKLSSFGIKVIVVTGWQNEDFAKQIEIMGQAFGAESKAKEYTAFCQKQVDLLAAALKNVAGQKTLYLENSGDYKTCIPGSGWNDMITMAGGKNIFDDMNFAKLDQSKGNVHSYPVDPEQILARNPAAVCYLIYDSKAISGTSIYSAPDPLKAESALKALASRPGWQTLGAVKSNSLYGISAFAGNACFKIVGATYLAKYLYPEAMAKINPDDFFKQWLEDYQGVKFQPGHTLAINAR
ncbi:ABC transporter substrate-binding protein [Desulfosporosinus sp. PR]|uniref:ABC transporter substrate-binding protein n=1 Tax=Candidatus Desulfosporosinus nitrosoreducens TaxID=3401928 RepID=UPI0027EEBEC5|nr:ABC transporter substrate-binding protein [Desulfosporosinus sp. PR]MDQ7095738.1 ABC transporter substrate-binding protein [Desulfosporosinus sp. PR]